MNSNTLPTELEQANSEELKYSRMIADLPGPKGQPILGNMLQLGGQQAHLTFMKWFREFGPVFRMSALGRSFVVVSDRIAVNNMLRDRPNGFRRNPNGKAIMNELNISGVLTAESEEWRKQRKLVMGGLGFEVVRNFFPKMAFMTERLLQHWKKATLEGTPIDLHRDLKAMAIDIIVGVAMGHDINALNDKNDQLQRNFDNVLSRMQKRSDTLIPYWRHFKLPADRSAEKSAADIEQAVMTFIGNARERMRQQPELRQKPTNMLESMIAASDDPETDFNDTEVISNAILSVVGGEDSTSNSMAWMVNLLAQNPAAAAALTAEVDKVLGDAPLASEWDLMKQFPYLEAVHSESQRLRAVAPLLGLVSNADCVVADTFIPKDTLVIVSTVGEAQDETQFPQPELFQPERWIFEQKPHRDEDPARMLFPFGGGTRMCPGRFLAMTEIKMVISMLMRNFELELDTSAPPVEQVLNFFMGPSAVPVRLKLRKQ
jgi:cytochrome P450